MPSYEPEFCFVLLIASRGNEAAGLVKERIVTGPSSWSYVLRSASKVTTDFKHWARQPVWIVCIGGADPLAYFRDSEGISRCRSYSSLDDVIWAVQMLSPSTALNFSFTIRDADIRWWFYERASTIEGVAWPLIRLGSERIITFFLTEMIAIVRTCVQLRNKLGHG